MRYRRATFTALIIIISIFAGCISFAVENDQKKKLVIAGDINYPPFEFLSEDGGFYRGYNVDVMKALSIETGVEIDFIPLEWNLAKKALLENEIDAIQGMIRTDSREMFYDFSDAYHMSSQVIFVRTATNDISDIEDLKNRVVALQKGDVNDELMSSFKDIKIRFYNDQEAAMRALISGEAEAVLGNRETGIYYLQRMKESDQVKIVGETLLVNEYCVAVKNGDKETLLLINKGLRAIKANGTMKKIHSKWFGEKIPDQERWKSLMILAMMISAVLSVSLTLIFLINKRLQKEVDIRTEEVLKSNRIIHLQDTQKGYILNSMSNALVVFDNSGKITLFNQMARDIMDSDIEIGKHWSGIDLCKTIGIELFENAISTKAHFKGNTTFVNDACKSKYIKYTLNSVDYDGSEDHELIFMLIDNTQEKIFLDAMHQNEKLSTMGRLSSSIAHELRNPLNAIKQYVDLLPSKTENPKFMAQAMKVIPSELKRLNDIIDGLLDYSKFTDSKKEFIRLTPIIDDLAMLMKVDFLYKRINFSNEIEADELYVDPKHLKQILINLVVNALDAMPESGGAIEVKSYKMDDSIMLEVRDNGKGISKENLVKVIEPYYSTKATGYGMGLAISKQLVEENDGFLWIESELNKGTTVKLKFPDYPVKTEFEQMKNK